MPKRKFYVENNTVKVKPPFTGRERRPLEWNIRHARFLVEYLEAHRDEPPVDPGSNATSALCARYWPDCYTCPVVTVGGGASCCMNTPYMYYMDARDEEDYPAALDAARREVAFLEGLRDG